ncbi:arginine repressor [Aeromicrobium sp. YIM 150415]|uniref:Arginine repressor n=1 Tax=Aeromicrobium piscarium TaxID=2590901 RepID=A0A554S6R4_9ACTN|nr:MULTISPECIES: arginine repressor [Aeromicrobium]MBM9464884.1 arginine repressor [Aeromicrobium sp. YIM 150415]TSD62044.1 arginine repressor [Aeromicrobium piscarium]
MTTVPATKTARQQRIVELLTREEVRSQSDLVGLLAEAGISATVSTVSRDLVELGAVRIRQADGALVYAVPAEGGDPTPRVGDTAAATVRLQRLVRELMVTVEASANLVVLRTPPGAAQYLASAIDHAGGVDTMGTIAGDDTLLLICRDPHGGSAVADYFTQLAGQPA